ncbi:MAG: hypothetical protein IKQ88_05645 [Lachnospiraceae bacterium]|nr:hypothetical protein [Lachnospiraceae bacterium]
MIKDIKSEIKKLKETGTKRDLYRYVILKILDLCIKAFIAVMLIFLARTVIFFTIWGGKPVLNYIMENDRVMSDDQKEIFDYFKGKYDSFYVEDVTEDDSVVKIWFRFEDDINVQELGMSMQDLFSYLDDKETKLTQNYKIDVSYVQNYAGVVTFLELANYVDTKNKPELEAYVENSNGWWIYRTTFKNWIELEDYFCSVEGICGCWIMDMESIKDIHTDEWSKIKYISIRYYGEDEEVYEQQLKELFPNAEVHVDGYY